MLHGRFSGNSRPHAEVAADILRLQDGLFFEHWDVLQDAATKAESQSGLPMFGASFPEPGPQSRTDDSPLTAEQARVIVAPLYDALNQPAKKDVAVLLSKAATPDY